MLCLVTTCLGGEPETEALDAIQGFQVPEGLQVELYADGRFLANPVAFCFDDYGRIYVAETFRMYHGVEENRRGEDWLNDDLACQSVEDRLSMLHKWEDQFDGGMAYFTRFSERLRLVEDTDGDGRADQATIFSDNYNHPLDGLAAGVLAVDGTIYFACLPNIYRLQDNDQDGRAEMREVLHHGFGVRHAFIGHDLHGLTWGPDGRIYYSMGDRGFHVVNQEGKTLHSPDRGAVLRCNPDGSELEVFATGLRNPQELAFDQYGNLFTVDNNSDAGDRARLVYLPEGSDSGWRMEFQYLEGDNLRGPWTQEKLWHPQHQEQPAWMLPPLAWLGAGPSGMTYYPGLGLPQRYDNHFFVCDFRADRQSSIRTFSVREQGAGFELVDEREFWKHIVATDVDFGYDGHLYALDFIGGWEGTGQGRIYRLSGPAKADNPAVRELSDMFREGFHSQPSAELIDRLGHPDMRVRMRAQFALARRGGKATDLLLQVALHSTVQRARRHAIWALGQVSRVGENKVALQQLLNLLNDPDADVRSQTAKVVGDAGYAAAADPLIERLHDKNLAVRAHAAAALGKIRHHDALDRILAMIHENGDQDVFLRHAGVMALAGIADGDALVDRANHPSASVRMGILLALRQLADPRIARFLEDPEQRLIVEAARAIHDRPIPAAFPALAQMIQSYTRTFTAQEPLDLQDRSRFQFTREFWQNIEGSRVVDLTEHPKFQAGQPDETHTISVFSNGPERGANYGTRISGLIEAPLDGEYTFYLTSDDEGQLFLSSDEDPVNKRLIASVPTYTTRDNWNEFETQTSEPIRLDSGKRYFIEALHKEGGSPDHLAVGWKLPDGTMQRPLGAAETTTAADSTEMALLRRVLNANFRLGGEKQAAAVADYVDNPENPFALRRLAAQFLNQWCQPPPRDAILGHRQDFPSRDPELMRGVLRDSLAGMLQHATAELESDVLSLAATYGVQTDSETFVRWALDDSKSFEGRQQAIRLLARDQHERLSEVIEVWLNDADPRIRSEAIRNLASIDPDRTVMLLSKVLETAGTYQQQQAFVTLGAMGHTQADRLLVVWTKRLVNGQVPERLALDVLEAARERNTPELREQLKKYEASLNSNDPLSRFRMALSGGNAKRGEHTFFHDLQLRCQRCHRLGGRGGGEVGPDLSAIGAKDRQYILQSLVNPNAQFAQGFAYTTLFTDDGRSITGRLLRETDQEVVIQTTEKDEVVIARDAVENRSRGQSAMPANLVEQMSLRDLRDLVEFLAQQVSAP